MIGLCYYVYKWTFYTHIIVLDMQDEFASLPAIVPQGPIAILGLVIH